MIATVNPRDKPFYVSNGFVEESTIEDYYEEDEPAVVMVKKHKI